MDKFKKSAPVSYEQKFNIKALAQNEILKEKNQGKENKMLNKKRERDDDLNMSRKNSLIYEPFKKDKEEREDKDNHPTGNNSNDNKNKKNNKVIEDEDQSEKEESNQDEQSFDEYRMESEDNGMMSDYGGSDEDERDYSDGGVF